MSTDIALSFDEIAAREASLIAVKPSQQIEKKSPGSSKPPKVAAGRRNSPEKRSAPEAALTLEDPAAGLWTEGLKYLMTACNLKQSTARGFLGRFVKAAGSSECALQLIEEAKRRQVADPQAWLMAATRNAGAKGKAQHVDMTEAEQIAYLQAQAKRFSQ